MKKRWTVKEVCELTGLTGKHLYYFHHQKVAKAVEYSNYSVEGHNGYKLYDEAGLAKLRQIAMYYELGLKQNEIRDLMLSPNYDMHRALDELRAKLEEKRTRLERHIAAIEQLRMIGTRNGLLDMFNELSLETIGKNSLAFLQSSLGELWASDLDDQEVEIFNSNFERLLRELSQMDPQFLSVGKGEQIIKEMFRMAVHHLGFLGYILMFGIFVGALGEGTVADELAAELPVEIIPDYGEMAVHYMKNDFDLFWDEVAEVVASSYDTIGGPIDSAGSKNMVLSIKNLLADHFGLKHEEEYRLLFEQLDSQPYNGKQDYLGYILNALKYYTISKK